MSLFFHSRYLGWHEEEQRDDRRGIMAIHNKSHLFESLPEVPEKWCKIKM